MTSIDQLINGDIVRCPGNILSAESVSDFKVEMTGIDVIDGDSAWVIKYTCIKPNIQNCGDPEAKSYKGKIWVGMKNNAVLKNSCEISRNKEFIHGNTFENITDKQGKLFNYKIETSYKRLGDKYVLSDVDYITNIENISSKRFLHVVEVLPYNQSIKSRQYYNNTKTNIDFWDNYERP